jgi:hypothetical protein
VNQGLRRFREWGKTVETGPATGAVGQPCHILYTLSANGGDRLRQGFGRPTDVMPGFSKQLVKKPREKTIANSNELALAA